MFRSHTFWLKVTIVFQLVLAAFHALSLFSEPQSTVEAEQQVLVLMHSVKFDFGAGFTPTMMNLFTGLSACFTFAYLLGGLINIVVLRHNAETKLLASVVNVNLIVFVPCFLVMAFLTFLPPILMTGLVVVGLTATRLTLK